MNLKRSLALVLVFLMVFSNSALAAGKPTLTPDKSKAATKVVSPTIKVNNAEKNYKKTDKVRVIVEVDGDPAITYATKQGKKYSELSKSVKENLQKDILKKQDTVKSKFASKSIKMKFKQNFTTAFNGFSGEVEYAQIPAIESIDGVTKVTISHEYQRPEEQPDMKYSKEIVEAQKAWEDYGYKGEGMIVGIIDTGIDPSHKDMVLTDNSQEALKKDKVNALVAEKGLPGHFYTDKVPYGYNYADENDQILDLGPDASMHGMHVAGTVGANGDEEKGGIKGVAPEAQLLALKVFGNDPEMPSTWSDIYVKAIDDAIILGADVLNMSLGSTASFVLPDDPEQKAIERATDNGVLMSISAGNSGTINYGYSNSVFASNPDVGVVGSPGLSPDSLQVASLENNFMDLDAITYSLDGTENKAPFLSASSVDPLTQKQKSYEILNAGKGKPSDFEGKDFKGKYALIQRGDIGFVDKALNAQKAGAVGAIIYNNTDGFVSMASDAAIQIPQLFMLKPDGDKLAGKLAQGASVTIEFKGDKVTAPNPNAGKMSDFTSWGLTPNLDFKPEITAPGGNIYSTLNNDQYGVMSGTSMAAPHVSGGSALVLERVKNDFSNLSGDAKVLMAKNLLMNTSKLVQDKGAINSQIAPLGGKNPYSPRRQGAGVMQLHAALSTPIVVTEQNTNEAKVALKEINGDTATFTLKAENLSDQDVTYKVSGNVQTDLAVQDEDTGIFEDRLESQGIFKDGTISENAPWYGQYPISFSKQEITIPAKSSTTVDVTIDLADTVDWYNNLPVEELFENGYFVEGFVTLTDVNDVNPAINVPYVGFKGDWNKPPVLDEMVYDGNDVNSFFGYTGLYTSTDEEGSYDILGYNPVDESLNSSTIAISPNGDGVNDNAVPILSFLRNAKLVEYKVVDKDGKVLRKIKSDQLVRKNFIDGGRGKAYRLDPSNAWDGKVKNKVVADGQYYYEIDSTVDYPGKAPQAVKFPVIVDTKAPAVTASVKGDKLTVDATDENGSGVAYLDVLVNGKSVFGEDDLPLAGHTKEYTFKEAPADGSTVEVVAYDFAGNTGKATVENANDSTIPYIHVTSIEALGAFNTHELPIEGYVKDSSKITSFTVNGQAVELVWNAKEARYDFKTTITLEDGVQKIRIAGKDAAGNNIDFLREILVDTTAPEVKVNVPSSVNYNTKSVDLTATISDNFAHIRYFVDGSEEFYKEIAEPYVMNGYSKEVKTTVSLEPGDNTFTLELVDVAGNKTTKEVTIHRDERVSRIFGPDRYETSVEVSKKGWDHSDVVVLARGDEHADALAGVPLAAKYDAPLLLTHGNNLDAPIKDEIARLGAKKVYILGGTGAVLPVVEKQIKELGEINVVRLSGNTRYETAAAIAKEVAPKGSEKVVVANGYNFADALSVASYAGAQGLPILLVNATQDVPEATYTAISQLGAKETLVIGGTAVVTDSVASKLPKATRIAGQTRYETNVEVAKYFNINSNLVYLATGEQFPDSLSGAALAAKDKAGVVLVPNTLSEDTLNFLKTLPVGAVRVLGGPNAVSEETLLLVKGLLK